jgi:O-antigen/teichoic acid export membrane protein
VIGVLFLAEDIIGLIGGIGFFESGNVLRILIFALALIFFGQFFNTILIIGNLQKKLMWVLGIAAIFNIVANILFIPKYSYIASSYISVATELLVVLLTGGLVIYKIRYIPKIDGFMRIIMASILMAGFLYYFNTWNFFILILGSILCYFIFLWLFKAVKTEEWLSLVSKK